MSEKYTDLAASCILGPNLHEVYASLPVERDLATTEIQSLLKLVKQYCRVFPSVDLPPLATTQSSRSSSPLCWTARSPSRRSTPMSTRPLLSEGGSSRRVTEG